MKGKSESPSLKRQKPAPGKIKQGGFGLISSKGKKSNIETSMTPDRFEQSQTRVKKMAVRRRKSLYDADNTTQIFANETQISQDGSALDQTPFTLSQISAIDPSESDTLTATFRKKKKGKNKTADSTLEMAVRVARGEPDGAEKSFTRHQFSEMCLDDSTDDVGREADMEVDEVGDDDGDKEDESLSPTKKSKKGGKEAKNMAKKGGKMKLKVPFKNAAKKLKSLKKSDDGSKKTKKKDSEDFDALPDETTVPKTSNQTWKEKKQQRKMLKNNYDLIASAKKAWEDLRRSDLTDVKRKKICDDLMKLVQGKVKELSVVHDSARVIQCVVQYGSEQQREVVFEEIKDDVCELCKQKYAKYVVRKLIHYGSKEMKAQIFKSFHGHVRKLIRHKEASDVLEYAFNEFATAPQRLAILEEFYGPTFMLFKDHVHQSLDKIMTEQPEKRDMVIRSMKEALTPLVDKDLISHSLVHKVLHDFFTFADDKSKKEMIEGLREHIPKLLHTRDGTRVAMNCVWFGSVKDRKIIVKSLKTHVVKVCKEEHGHFLLLALFDSVDDTVLVHKAVLDEILKSLDEVVKDVHGRKVLLYLLCPRDSHHFHPDVVKILQEGDSNPTSKKDKTVRAKELLNHVSPHLTKYLVDHTQSMMSDNHMALLVKEIVTRGTGDVVPAMKAIVKLIAQPCSTTDGAINMVEHPACHIALKKIIANDKARLAAGEGILFSAILLEELPKSTVKVWAASNRGCFIILSLLEVGCSTITEKVKGHLQQVHKSLKKMKFKGAELLLEKLEGPAKDREFPV